MSDKAKAAKQAQVNQRSDMKKTYFDMAPYFREYLNKTGDILPKGGLKLSSARELRNRITELEAKIKKLESK